MCDFIVEQVVVAEHRLAAAAHESGQGIDQGGLARRRSGR